MATPTDSLSPDNYKLTPEEMWKCMKNENSNWGIEGYSVPRKYMDVYQIKWEKRREEIKKQHKAQWPPKDWPKAKGSDQQVPPQRLTFVDDTVKLANSFNDPVKSKELHDNLAPKGIFNPPKKKEPVNLRDKFFEEEKKNKDREANLGKPYDWKVNAIEKATDKMKEDEKNKKTKTQKNLEKYTHEKPSWPRCDRVTIMADSEYVGEHVPFYNTYAKEGEKVEKLFFPKVNIL